ncbi:DUF6408 family protein [Yinghuangia soli]|uniref:Uncharacterized protein n=1 Tax=Yinghuangia soli TaxID=2908204 RepID=A0AA41PV24_9ACTN|nr:DUF6408 family protein [Yinghuangia soli]MCF2525860.1 hypothetical protein [Yinghuangia soli]
MNPFEHKPARRTWIREILIGAAAAIVADLLSALVEVVTQLLA